MSCIKGPPITPPTLPGGITISPPAIPDPPGLDLGLCCKLPPVPLPPIPISIPSVTLTSLIVAAMNTAIAGACAYVNSLALDCPIE